MHNNNTTIGLYQIPLYTLNLYEIMLKNNDRSLIQKTMEKKINIFNKIQEIILSVSYEKKNILFISYPVSSWCFNHNLYILDRFFILLGYEIFLKNLKELFWETMQLLYLHIIFYNIRINTTSTKAVTTKELWIIKRH